MLNNINTKRKFETTFDELAQFGACLRLLCFDEDFNNSTYQKFVNEYNEIKNKITQFSCDIQDDEDSANNAGFYKLLFKMKKCAVRMNAKTSKKLCLEKVSGKKLAKDVEALSEQLKKLTNVISKNLETTTETEILELVLKVAICAKHELLKLGFNQEVQDILFHLQKTQLYFEFCVNNLNEKIPKMHLEQIKELDKVKFFESFAYFEEQNSEESADADDENEDDTDDNAEEDEIVGDNEINIENKNEELSDELEPSATSNSSDEESENSTETSSSDSEISETDSEEEEVGSLNTVGPPKKNKCEIRKICFNC